MAERELKPTQVARRLGYNPATIRRWCREGVLECLVRTTPGGRTRYVILESHLRRFQAEGS